MIKLENKRGFLRILEAFIAVIMLLTVLLVVVVQQQPADDGAEAEIRSLQRHILNVVNQDLDIRAEILNNDTSGVNNTIESLLPSVYNYSVRVCPLNEICSLGYFLDTDVFVDQTVISANLTEYDPKLLKIFFWRVR